MKSPKEIKEAIAQRERNVKNKLYNPGIDYTKHNQDASTPQEAMRQSKEIRKSEEDKE